MSEERDYLSITFKIGIGFFVLAILGAILFLFIPSILSALMGPIPVTTSNSNVTNIGNAIIGLNKTVENIIAVLTMIFVVISSLILFISEILAIVEIFKSTNDSSWKAIWLVINIFLGVFGLILYMKFARKDLKKK